MESEQHRYPRIAVSGDETDGLFGPRSVTWRVHSSPLTLLGGMRALLIQALHPRAVAGVAQHSSVGEDTWGRFRRTSDYLLTVVYGSRREAETAAAHVRRIHRRVAGVDDVTGLPYRADDPDLLLWTHCVLVESLLASQQRFGRRLEEEVADRYVAETVRLATLVGLHPDEVPASQAGLRRRVASYDDLLRMTPGAETAWRILERPPLPAGLAPAWRMVFGAATSLLSPGVMRMYGRPAPKVPAPVLQMAVSGGSWLARAVGPPPPVLAAARKRARLEGVRI
jgi:uncharacterized protein (DUF2236 family)